MEGRPCRSHSLSFILYLLHSLSPPSLSLSLSFTLPLSFLFSISYLPLVHSIKRTTREAVFESAKEFWLFTVSNVSNITPKHHRNLFIFLSFSLSLSLYFYFSFFLFLHIRTSFRQIREKVAFSAVSTRCCSYRGNDASDCCRRPRGS